MIYSIVTIATSIYLGIILLLYVAQTRLIYLPTREIITSPADIGLAYDEVSLKTADGVTISGWFIPADKAKGTLLFFHGNAGNMSHRLTSIETFHRLQLDVFIIDYRGYGQSEGRLSEQGTYQDAEAAWCYLVKERHTAPDEIIVFGRSLGGGMAAWLAEQHPPKLLILESTFTSIPAVAAGYYPFLPVRWLARIRYPTMQRLPAIQCSLLITHSPDDDVIPYHHGQRLFAAANEPKTFIELQGRHNESYLVALKLYETKLAAFVDNLTYP